MGVLKKLTSEYFGVSVRKDEGMVFDIGGKKYIMLFEDYRFIRNLIPMDDDGNLFIRKEFSFLDEPGYVCCAHMGGDKYYNHAYDYYIISESVLENAINHTIDDGVVMLLNGDHGDHDENFQMFDILEGVGGMDLDDGIRVTHSVRYVEVIAGSKSCRIYTDEDYARADAIEECEDVFLCDFTDSMPQSEFERQRGFSDDWIDTDRIRDWLREDFSGYYREESDDEYGCRLYGELVSYGVIQNNSEYFDVDLDEPTFDPDDYRDELVERVADEDGVSHDEAVSIVDEYDDEEFIRSLIEYGIVKKTDEYFELDHESPLFDVDDKTDEMLDKFDDDDLVGRLEELYDDIPSDFYDLKKLAETAVDVDGVGHFLSSYDGEEHMVNVDGVDYFVYIS
jgi:hypothetical protein